MKNINKNTDLNNIDYICEEFDKLLFNKTSKYTVESIFTNSINLVSEEKELLTLINKSGFINSVVVGPEILKQVKKESLFILGNNILKTKNISIKLEEEKMRSYTFDFEDVQIDFFNTDLKEIFKTSESDGLAQFYQSKMNTINEYLYKKIKSIDEETQDIEEFTKRIIPLYSGGIGSTPSMDDAILGMYIVAKSLGADVRVFNQDYSKTTFISQKMLESALKNQISDNVKALYTNINRENILKLAKEIGSTSGYDMLVGSFLYIKKRSDGFCLKN